jgi:adenylyltransferase/sulfurtransferase
MTVEEMWRERYARQVSLTAVGEEGQQQFASTSAVVMGAGAVGSNSAEMLARMGIGRIIIIDRDVVELSDLHRSRMLSDEDVGEPKALALANAIKATMPDARVQGIAEDMTVENVTTLIRRADVVVDGMDNMESRLVLNDGCLELRIPWVLGRVVATKGIVASFPAGGPCLQCIYPDVESQVYLSDSRSEGIDPTVASAIAGIQVAQVSRLVLGAKTPSRLITLDAWTNECLMMDIKQVESCPACVEGRRKFLSTHIIKTFTTLCDQNAVQISPHRRYKLDLDSKARELEVHGKVRVSGQMLRLTIEDLDIFIFESGRALVKGTCDIPLAKRLYGRFVGL